MLVGPRLNRMGTNLGGATRSFEELITYLEQQGISHAVLNTQAGKGLSRAVFLVIGFLTKVWKADVVFINLSQNGIRKLAPVLSRMATALGKKVVIRPFGSALKTIYQELPGKAKKNFTRYVLNADLLYVQTQELLNFFRPLGKRVAQLKTARPQPQSPESKGTKPYAKRFIFLGQLRKEKGIDELIACIEELGEDYTIDLFGPIEEPTYDTLKHKPYYKGLLKGREEVLTALSQYDVLVLPTYYRGEGYPGVIVEAYSMGLPVISTNWKSIPEIVIPYKTGLLVEPRSAEALKVAMTSINAENHAMMRQGALDFYAEHFELEKVMARVIEEINELFAKQ